MTYTIFHCHLSEPSPVKVGDKVNYGDKLGRMGSTGISSAAHVHTTLVQDLLRTVPKLDTVLSFVSDLPALMKQYYYFLDKHFYKTKMRITSHFGTVDYGKYNKDGEVIEWEFHPAYDTVPDDANETMNHWDFFWNRTKTGVCVANYYDTAYGNVIGITYEA